MSVLEKMIDLHEEADMIDMLEEVDASLAEADAGQLEDTEIMEARLAKKYGLVI